MNREVTIQATANQRQFLQSVLEDKEVEVVGFGGARGGGKTNVSCMAAVLFCLMYSGIKGLMLRRTTSAAAGSIIDEIKKCLSMLGLPENSVKLDSKNVFTFPNGSKIIIGYIKLALDYEQYQGVEYSFIVLEELTQHTEDGWDKVSGSNRSGNPSCTPKRWFTCNPGGVGHTWVKKRYIDKSTRDYASRFVQSLIKHNIPQQKLDPGYAKRILAKLPKWQKRQWRDGDWDAMAGSFFSTKEDIVRPTFYPKKTEDQPGAIQIPFHASWYAGVDFGSQAAFAVIYFARWRSLTGRSHCHIVKEIYRPNRHMDEQAELVKLAEEALREDGLLAGRVTYYADPNVSKRVEHVSTEVGKTIRSVWADHGFYVLPAHTNSRIAGWELIKYLEHKDILTIAPTCYSLLDERTQAIYEGTKSGGAPKSDDLEQGTDINDHALDALRYGIVSTFKVGFREKEVEPYVRYQGAGNAGLSIPV